MNRTPDTPEDLASPAADDAATLSQHDVSAVMNAIRVVVRTIRRANVDVERELGISLAQLFVLEQLNDRAAESVNDLAERTMTHQSSVSVVVRRLVERGLVRKTPAAADARRMQLSLSDEGRALLARAPRTAQSQLVAGIRAMPPERARELARALHEWLAAAALDDQAPGMFFEDGLANG